MMYRDADVEGMCNVDDDHCVVNTYVAIVVDRVMLMDVGVGAGVTFTVWRWW